ncbi:MAG: hypothetical protein BroJett030_32820 [Alphaproteobacteria bacterium]|nr:MAG: hypothetical protein BroJett030_32820 [Alphaproteobacteria bacterium]
MANASLATISLTTRPAPKRQASRRNGASETPDIGAASTRLRKVSPPIAKLAARSGARVGLFGCGAAIAVAQNLCKIDPACKLAKIFALHKGAPRVLI